MATVVTQPDRPRGRGRRSSPCPIADVALREKISLLRPERVGEPGVANALRAARVELGVVVAFGQFLPKRVREAPSLGYLINGHASLLPAFRGAAPIARAILAGETRTGVSVMRVEKEMDAGPVALVRELEIGADENAGELAERLSRLTAQAIGEVVAGIAQERVVWTPQDAARVSYAPKIERSETALDWSESAPALARRVRALAPTPGATTSFAGERLRILAARTAPGRADVEPGTVRRGESPALAVASGDGWLAPLVIQRAGGVPLAVEVYLRGRPIPDGARFGG